MTVVKSLYAAGASSRTCWLVSQTMPSIDFTKSSWLMVAKAFVRDILLPAPWLQELQLSGLPLPFTMNDPTPMLPGIMPNSPSAALVAPAASIAHSTTARLPEFLLLKGFSPLIHRQGFVHIKQAMVLSLLNAVASIVR